MLCASATFSSDEVIEILGSIGITPKDENFNNEINSRFTPVEDREEQGDVVTVYVET